MSSIQRLFALACLSLLTACGGGSDDGGPVSPPVAVGKADPATAAVGTRISLDASDSSSPRGEALSYQWQLASAPASSKTSLADAEQARASFVADVPGNYEARLVVRDGTTVSLPVAVYVRATSDVPVAIAQAGHSVMIGGTVVLDGSGSVPPTGTSADRLRYQWTLTEAPEGSQAFVRNNQSARAELYADVQGVYKAVLQVSYEDKQSEPLLVTITAGLGNIKPVADAGGPYAVFLGETVTLDASKSHDPDNAPAALSYRWTFVEPSFEGTSMLPQIPQGSQLRAETAIRNSDQKVATFTPDRNGVYTVYLYVYDGMSLSEVQTVQVVVTKKEGAPNAQPVASMTRTPTFEFYTPVASQEWTLNVPYMVYSGGMSYDDDVSESSALEPRFRWIKSPEGFVQQPLTPAYRPRFTPDVEGEYTFEMIVNDGRQDSAPLLHTIHARRGAATDPFAMMTVDSKTVQVGKTAWFDGKLSASFSSDEPVFHWLLLHKPEGSKASLKFEDAFLQKGTSTVTLRNARAGITADKPGLYQVVMYTSTALGYTSQTVAAGAVLFKDANNPPSADYMLFDTRPLYKTSTPTLNFDTADQPYVINGAALLPTAYGVLDPDSDELYHLWSLEQPAGSELQKVSDREAFTTEYNLRPAVPGRYSLTYVASDGIAYTAPLIRHFNAVLRENYPSLLLEDLHSSSIGSHGSPINWRDNTSLMFNRHGAVSQRTFPYTLEDPTFDGLQVGRNVLKTMRLTAFDRDYTITNLTVSGSLTNPAGVAASFGGLANNTVVKKGQSLDVELVANVSFFAPDLNNFHGIAYHFEIAEKPGWVFTYRPYDPCQNESEERNLQICWY